MQIPHSDYISLPRNMFNYFSYSLTEKDTLTENTSHNRSTMTINSYKNMKFV